MQLLRNLEVFCKQRTPPSTGQLVYGHEYFPILARFAQAWKLGPRPDNSEVTVSLISVFVGLQILHA